jgi:hypothetical protein
MIKNLREWQLKHKINKADFDLLVEAYRRFHMFARGKSLAHAWVGLGYSEYEKSEYFKPISSRPKRALGWFGLSDKGIKVIKDLNKMVPWKYKYNFIIFENKY